MNTVFLILGGNLGDRRWNIDSACELIEKRLGATAKRSAIYVTAAWGKTDQPDFYNQALQLETTLKANDLLQTLLSIEKEMGRVRTEKWAERIIDIDILFYNDEVIDEPELKIPHPHLQNRRFVMVPLNEIAGGFVHPKLKKTIKDLLDECGDDSEVRKLEG